MRSLANVCDPPTKPVSKKEFCIAGILTTVYGLDELHQGITEVVCLWLLHPRLETHVYMEPLALTAIDSWRDTDEERTRGYLGLIAVSFDARNHGTRMVKALSNEDWRGGNLTHAQDLFSIIHGTAMDVSLLLEHLPSYIFGRSYRREIIDNIVMGISLGAHAAWHCAVHEPEIRAAVIALGCPDYTRLMTYRAAKSQLNTFTSAQASGESFIGSSSFPPGLEKAVRSKDPVGLLLNGDTSEFWDGLQSIGSPVHKWRSEMVTMHLGGKDLFILSGERDKLVPYACSAPFLKTLRSKVGMAIDKTHVTLKDFTDKVYPETGHAMTREMVNDALEFIRLAMAGMGS
ncbi:MAG: hypothetical protein M1823_000996 [Watsoniomyces obsoletus]|nr:MAG: hypothetical protein M1823_000996 [Watsoniomyces obsoletus]